MITLYSFGPGFGLSDLSPFVRKAQTLLKMSGLPYQENTKGFRQAPKGKLPYIVDDGQVIADTTFIRWHLEKKYGIDFDQGLTSVQKAQNWAMEKMLESHSYFVGTSEAWLHTTDWAPACIRAIGVPNFLVPLIAPLVKSKIKKSLITQGMGRHTREESLRLAFQDIQALSDILGTQDFFGGAQPCGSDATAYAFIAAWLNPGHTTLIGIEARKYENFTNYAKRMTARFA